jgi:hypothetical protein
MEADSVPTGHFAAPAEEFVESFVFPGYDTVKMAVVLGGIQSSTLQSCENGIP